MSSLGDCEKCHGPLCVSGSAVVCQKCGHVHQHPDVVPAVKAEPPAPVIPPQDYPATWQDRVARLEKIAASLEGRVAALEAERPPESQPEAGGKKRR